MNPLGPDAAVPSSFNRESAEGLSWQSVVDRLEKFQKGIWLSQLDRDWISRQLTYPNSVVVRHAQAILASEPNLLKRELRQAIHAEYKGRTPSFPRVYLQRLRREHLSEEAIEALRQIYQFDIDYDFSWAAAQILAGATDNPQFAYRRFRKQFDTMKLLQRFEGRYLNLEEVHFLEDLVRSNFSFDVRKAASELLGLQRGLKPRQILDSQWYVSMRWYEYRLRTSCAQILLRRY